MQLFSGGTFGSPRRNWDGHEDMKANHGQEALRIDRPVAGLLRDLRRRGMLDDTLVLFTTEFGRTPFTQSAADVVGKGRDHNQYGFTVWLAGAGLKHGIAYGSTDEIGWKAAENPVTWPDFHATVLHLLGIDHERLTYYHNGIRRRLTNVHGEVDQADPGLTLGIGKSAALRPITRARPSIAASLRSSEKDPCASRWRNAIARSNRTSMKRLRAHWRGSQSQYRSCKWPGVLNHRRERVFAAGIFRMVLPRLKLRRSDGEALVAPPHVSNGRVMRWPGPLASVVRRDLPRSGLRPGDRIRRSRLFISTAIIAQSSCRSMSTDGSSPVGERQRLSRV